MQDDTRAIFHAGPGGIKVTVIIEATIRELLAMNYENQGQGTSLVAQWLRIHLPMQGTRVRVLVWEDPTCR